MATMLDDPRSKQAMRDQNPDNFNPRIPALYPKEKDFYIFSVARKDFKPTSRTYLKSTLPGCKDGERYIRCAVLSHPMQQANPIGPNGENIPRPESAMRVAIDALNPNNLSMDPYLPDSPGATSANCNLIAEGLFPSWNAVPTEEELQRAEQARDTTARKRVDEAFRLESTRPAELANYLLEHPEVHDAMDLLGLEANFHRKHEVKRSCPTCGTSIKDGIALHILPDGTKCVVDWKAAYEAGAVKKEDVPPGKRWQGFGKMPQDAA